LPDWPLDRAVLAGPVRRRAVADVVAVGVAEGVADGEAVAVEVGVGVAVWVSVGVIVAVVVLVAVGMGVDVDSPDTPPLNCASVADSVNDGWSGPGSRVCATPSAGTRRVAGPETARAVGLPSRLKVGLE